MNTALAITFTVGMLAGVAVGAALALVLYDRLDRDARRPL